MFGFLKKTFQLAACVTGKIIPITEVNDQVFSQKMMGDGYAIIPESNQVISPVDGVIETIFPTKHALGLKTKEGVEIILHIGLDTVNLKGEGFTVLVKEKSKVKIGTCLIQVDRKLLETKGYDLTTMVVLPGYEKELKLLKVHEHVEAKEIVAE